MVKVILGAAVAGWLTAAIFMAAAEGPSPFNDTDHEFLTATAIVSNFELRAAELAEKMAPSDSVRLHAQQVRLERARFAEALKRAVIRRQPSFQLPAGIDSEHRAMLARLRSRKHDFAAEFARQMAYARAEAVLRYHLYLRQKHADRAVKAVVGQWLTER